MFFWNPLGFDLGNLISGSSAFSNVGNLISGSSVFSKSSLNIWKFTVHVLLKAGLENFEHFFASMWDECNCVVVWTFFSVDFSLGLEWKLTFSSPGYCWVFQICWHVECSTFTASSYRILNSSTGISSPPLALFVVMLSKAHLTSHSRMSGFRWVIIPRVVGKGCFLWPVHSLGKTPLAFDLLRFVLQGQICPLL